MRRLLIALSLAAVIAFLGLRAQPQPPTLSTRVTGDRALAEQARPLLSGALDRVSVAVVDGPDTTYAGFGADENTEYEIGSITKTFTGMLLADAIQRREVTAETKVGTLLPLTGPVADVSLRELATHRSGLPAQSTGLQSRLLFLGRHLTHRNPFTEDVSELLETADAESLSTRGVPAYSNLGAALLGHALSAAARMGYADLVRERIFVPLEMSTTTLPSTSQDLPSGALSGFSASGIAEAPWAIAGWSPAGGARSNIADLTRFARALLDGLAPGIDALTPSEDFGAQRIGYMWTTQTVGTRTVTLKNGLTGGFAGKIVVDRVNSRAVIVLSNTAAAVDRAADGLLIGPHAWPESN